MFDVLSVSWPLYIQVAYSTHSIKILDQIVCVCDDSYGILDEYGIMDDSHLYIYRWDHSPGIRVNRM